MNDKAAENAAHYQSLKRFVNEPAQSRSQRAAQEAFYLLVNAKLERHALRMTQYNDDIAKAAMQDAWVKILQNAHTYNPAKSSVLTWASMITASCVKDELRDHYHHHPAGSASAGNAGSDDYDGDEQRHDIQACPMPSGEDVVYGKQVLNATAACLASLPAGARPNYRLAFELSLDPELTYADMASQLQQYTPEPPALNAEQVRRWVNEAARRMRECLTRRLGLHGGQHA